MTLSSPKRLRAAVRMQLSVQPAHSSCHAPVHGSLKGVRRLHVQRLCANHPSRERQVVKLFSPSDDPETQKVENLVDEAGREFIESQTFSTPHVPELEIAARFHKTQMPTEPVDVEGYFHDLVKNVVEDGIHTSCPQMIGHMTSALPNYCPMLSKLMVLQKHRTFRAKFSMKSIQNRHILVF